MYCATFSIPDVERYENITPVASAPSLFVAEGKMRPLRTNLVKVVKNSLEKALTYREISSNLKISVGVVHKVAKKFRVVRCANKGGRPSKLTESDKRLIVRNIRRGRCSTAVDTAKYLATTINLIVYSQTIRNVLKSCGLKAAHKLKKPAISSINRKKRLDFAEFHEHWTMNDWKKVIWSDETKINRFGSDGRLWCWKTRGEPLSERTTQFTVKHGGGSIMVWGCMTTEGVGELA